jgi:putative hydrolase of the HAD superfamily
MNKKIILFDFGGTLDTNGIHWSEYFRDLYKKFGIKVRYENYRKAFIESDRILSSNVRKDMTYKETLKEQLRLQFEYLNRNSKIKKSFTPVLIEKMIDSCYACVNGTISYTREILKSFQGDFKLGVISNFYGNLTVVLAEFDLKNVFDSVIDSAVFGITKPDERIFKAAITEMRGTPESAVMIGDSYGQDIVPAKTLGLSTVWLDGRSWTRPGDTSKADFIIHSIKELPLLVSKHFLN